MAQLALLLLMLLGAVVSVPVGDRFGLRAPVLMTLLGMALAPRGTHPPAAPAA